MDVPKTNNNFKVSENLGPEILSGKEKKHRDPEFLYIEEESAPDHKEDVENAFLNSYLKEPDNFVVSTNEWLRTWRPLIN